MTKGFSLSRYCMAKYYDHAMRKMEYGGMENKRQTLLSQTSGDILEIGAGTGLNLRHYPATISSITVTEPDAFMNKELEKKKGDAGSKLKAVIPCPAENIEADDNSFDSVVSTLVFCSVSNPARSLAEVKRVLKPGGRLFFIEHVLAEQEPDLIKWQRRWEPLWKQCGGNCHLTRPTGTHILEAGFSFETLKHPVLQKVPGVVKHAIEGIASIAS